MPTTTMAALASDDTSSPVVNVDDVMICALIAALTCWSMASSTLDAVRASEPYALMTDAPTTDSATAPRTSPTRSRTLPYADRMLGCRRRTTRTNGTKQP